LAGAFIFVLKDIHIRPGRSSGYRRLISKPGRRILITLSMCLGGIIFLACEWHLDYLRADALLNSRMSLPPHTHTK